MIISAANVETIFSITVISPINFFNCFPVTFFVVHIHMFHVKNHKFAQIVQIDARHRFNANSFLQTFQSEKKATLSFYPDILLMRSDLDFPLGRKPKWTTNPSVNDRNLIKCCFFRFQFFDYHFVRSLDYTTTLAWLHK